MNKADRQSKAMAMWAEMTEVPDIADILPFVAQYKFPPKKRKLLAVKASPQCVMMTEKQKAEVAGCCPRYVTLCNSDPEFRRACTEISAALLGQHCPEVTNAFIRDAKLGDSGNQVRLLQQCGVLDKPTAQGAPQQVVNVTILQQQRDEKLGRGLNRFGYEVELDG